MKRIIILLVFLILIFITGCAILKLKVNYDGYSGSGSV